MVAGDVSPDIHIANGWHLHFYKTWRVDLSFTEVGGIFLDFVQWRHLKKTLLYWSKFDCCSGSSFSWRLLHKHTSGLAISVFYLLSLSLSLYICIYPWYMVMVILFFIKRNLPRLIYLMILLEHLEHDSLTLLRKTFTKYYTVYMCRKDIHKKL